MKSEKEWMEKLSQEGFSNLVAFDMEPDFTPGEHTHDLQTVHVILSGELVITEGDRILIYRAGDRVEFSAGTKHHARFGGEKGRMIAGVKL